jgi:hypothetical protein
MDYSDYYTIEVVDFKSGGAYVPIEITPRTIELTTASATKNYDGKELTADRIYVSMGTLIEGHTLTAEVIGSIVSAGETKNTVNKESIVILDSAGNDVTSNYRISAIKLGTLKII